MSVSASFIQLIQLQHSPCSPFPLSPLITLFPSLLLPFAALSAVFCLSKNIINSYYNFSFIYFRSALLFVLPFAPHNHTPYPYPYTHSHTHTYIEGICKKETESKNLCVKHLKALQTLKCLSNCSCVCAYMFVCV